MPAGCALDTRLKVAPQIHAELIAAVPAEFAFIHIFKKGFALKGNDIVQIEALGRHFCSGGLVFLFKNVVVDGMQAVNEGLRVVRRGGRRVAF